MFPNMGRGTSLSKPLKLNAEMPQPVPLCDVDIPHMVGMGSERPFEDACELTQADPQKAQPSSRRHACGKRQGI